MSCACCDASGSANLRNEVLASPRLHVVNHPMVQHKLAILRDRETSSKQFRELVREIALFEGYEATRDFPLRDVDVQTPVDVAHCRMIAGKKVAVVPILRAGLGMVDGILDLIPAARVGHIGLYRDPQTHEPHTYYCKFPADIDQRICLVTDPMLATGGSIVAAVRYLREAGVRDIRLLCVLAAPEGIARVLEADENVELYVGAVDDHLNEKAYIVPGLGDAGDRIYGTL
jgi:uracil phosphoribosyltransferase